MPRDEICWGIVPKLQKSYWRKNCWGSRKHHFLFIGKTSANIDKLKNRFFPIFPIFFRFFPFFCQKIARFFLRFFYNLLFALSNRDFGDFCNRALYCNKFQVYTCIYLNIFQYGSCRHFSLGYVQECHSFYV